MTAAVFILLFACLLNLGLGLFVLLRNPQAYYCRFFFAITVSISFWAASNFLTDASSQLSLNILFNKLAYLFALLAVAAMVLFAYSFPKSHQRPKANRVKLFYVTTILMVFLSVTKLVAGKVTRDTHGLHFTSGMLLPIYAAYILVLVGLIIARQFKNIRHGTPRSRNQAQFILYGFAFTIVITLLTNLIIPAINNNFQSAKLGPLSTVIFVGSVTYAIIKYRLFDIRFVVARSAAYVLLIAFLAGLYTFIVFGLTRILIHGTSGKVAAGQQIINIFVGIFLALTFQPFRRIFDKFTNKLFFQDSYDPQDFLDKLNNVLVSTIQVDALLSYLDDLLCSTFKSSYVNFFVDTDDANKPRVIGKAVSSTRAAAMEHLYRQIQPTKYKVLALDEDEDEENPLHNAMRKADIAIVLALSTHKQRIGFIAIGYKQTGSIYSQKDIKLLKIAADEISLAIQNALRVEEIENFNVTLQQKVENATSELRRTNEKLKALDEAKDEFVSMASHQLRTPLTSVKGYVSMVLEGDAGKISSQQRQLLDQAFASSQRMVYLIADLLNVSRLRTGKFVIEAKPCNLPDIVETEINQLQGAAAARNLHLEFIKPSGFPIVNLDETKIRQVIMNFVDNAIYYTPAGGLITVELSATNSAIIYRVKDNGLGVPKEEQHHLFTKFFRANNARKARPDGTGLGLFMAKKVVIAQGGTIIFESTENKGSTFGFSFPRAAIEVK